MHWFDDVQGIPQPFRKGPRPAAPVPEDRRERADHRGYGQDPCWAPQRLRKSPQSKIPAVLGRGATSGGARDAANLRKPALSGGTIRFIGSTTYKEFRNHFEKDRALLRRCQKIDVNEPTIEDTVKILAGLRSAFENHHKVKYTPDAIKSAVELSARYINDRKLPDKAIDVIDEVGAMQMLVPPAKRRKTITSKEIEAEIGRANV